MFCIYKAKDTFLLLVQQIPIHRTSLLSKKYTNTKKRNRCNIHPWRMELQRFCFFDTKNKVRHADYALSKGCVNNFFARRFNVAEESSSSGITVLK